MQLYIFEMKNPFKKEKIVYPAESCQEAISSLIQDVRQFYGPASSSLLKQIHLLPVVKS